MSPREGRPSPSVMLHLVLLCGVAVPADHCFVTPRQNTYREGHVGFSRQLVGLAIVGLAGCAGLRTGGQPVELTAKIVSISEEYANINTDLSHNELSSHGIRMKTRFRVRFGDRTITAMLGSGYSDVPRGKWVALIEEDGNMQLAISFGHAATDLGCQIGDTLYIETPIAP